MHNRMTGAELLESGKRFSVAMWEYSWMTQRSGRQDEYADWDKVLDEAVERGYQCLRIDAFPHCIAADADGRVADEISFLPIPERFMWGNHEQVAARPRDGLIEFMQKAKDRGLYVGLSSWYNDDTEHRRLMVHSPADYARIWIETLDILDRESLLDMVVWVDICNEFPLPQWCPYPFADIVGLAPDTPPDRELMGKMRADWGEREVNALTRYFTESIDPVRARYPDLKYTFSAQGSGSGNFTKGDTKSFDLAEPHIWSIEDRAWSAESGFYGAIHDNFPDGLLEHARKCMELYPSNKKRVRKILDDRTDFWRDWATERELPLVTTEAWTTVFYEDLSQYGLSGEWNWFKEVAEVGVELAVNKGWQGICTSNFCQPHFEGMWEDVGWHRRMTNLICGT